MVQFIVNKLRKMGLYDSKPILFVKRQALKFLGRKMKKFGVPALNKLCNIFEEENIEYWADFGTLLGIYREGKFLAHDFDIDMGVMKTSYSKLLEEKLQQNSFKKLKEYYINEELVEQTWTWNGVLIDIFYYGIKDDKVYAYEFYTKGEVVKVKRDDNTFECTNLDALKMYLPYLKTKIITFNGFSIRVPEDEDKYLRAVYGDGYMVPDKNWTSDSMDNIEKLDNINTRCIYF